MAESDPGAMSVSTRDELILMIYISKLLVRFLPTMGIIYRHLKTQGLGASEKKKKKKNTI